jgi:hypothetical protein
MAESVDAQIRKGFDDAILALVYREAEVDGGVDGERLLALIVEEASHSMARLKEQGLLENVDEDDESG